MSQELNRLLGRVRACDVCAAHLPLGPRPVVSVWAEATLMIIGQAPGTKVHQSGIPWDDASGDRLRDWLQVDRQTFYQNRRIAIMPMGFCYPGVDKNGGDRPPRPECAPLWHPAIMALLPDIRMTLLVGAYAQRRYLGARAQPTMTATVRAWQDYAPATLPLPHPSWRNTGWIKKNPWFTHEILPVLRATVRDHVI